MTDQHILFVEAQGRTLHEAMHGLAVQRPDWYILRAATSDAALDVIGRYGIGVVVADCRAGGKDCEQLFARIRERDPAVVRVALVPAADGKTVTGLPCAHQYVTASCTPQCIERILAGALSAWRRAKDNPRLLDFVSNLGPLPTPPILYFDIKEELDAPHGSLRGISQLVARDPALTARILKIANSGLYAMPRRISDLTTAIGLLGTEMLLALVLAARLYSQLPIPGLDIDKIWLHSMAVSLLAKQIVSEETGDRHEADVASIAGLLHDVGQLIFLVQDASTYFSIIRKSEGRESVAVPIEREQLGVDHAQVGAHLMTLWGLPETIVAAVAAHHAPDVAGVPDPVRRVIGAVYTAEWLLEEFAVHKELLDSCPLRESLDAFSSSRAVDYWRYVEQLVERGIVA